MWFDQYQENIGQLLKIRYPLMDGPNPSLEACTFVGLKWFRYIEQHHRYISRWVKRYKGETHDSCLDMNIMEANSFLDTKACSIWQ